MPAYSQGTLRVDRDAEGRRYRFYTPRPFDGVCVVCDRPLKEHDADSRCLCRACNTPLSGKQTVACSDPCRVRAWEQAKYGGQDAEEVLAALPQEELRRVIRRVCERRWKGLRGRISVRFGKSWMPHGGPGPRH